MKFEDKLNEYYAHYDEDGRLISRHGKVEYTTTMKYIEKYLCSDMRIIEIGAATGRYSHALAGAGYHVDAVELSEHNIEIFKKNTVDNEPVSIVQGNAVDLSVFKSDSYDITLLLGPMYHLFTHEEQIKALSEAIRVTKHGGVVFAAYCMFDATILTYGFIQNEIYNMIDKCGLNKETFDSFPASLGFFKLYRKEDIKELRGHFDVTPLHLVASDGYANHMRQKLEEMDEEMYELYIKYHLATCERQDIIGYSHHTIDIFRKN